ncbi:hypothetical protein AMTRI_Chr09g16620 [Amborella trichopoda]
MGRKEQGGSVRSSKSGGKSESVPLVVALNCLEDCVAFEAERLSGIAVVEHVELGRIAEGRIEAAAAVLLHSLAYLPRAAQRRLHSSQLLLCLGSSDKAVDSSLATDLGLHLVHVDTSRAEEVADTVMALFLALLRRTHLLSQHHASSSSSACLGSLQPLCRGMRRCRGLVLGIVGRSASASCLATRTLAFKMSVLYFDVDHQGKGKTGRSSVSFPPAARRMDTLNDLLAASDLVSLHCALSNETIQIINAECLQHIKPGAFIVNTGSSQLLDDCALKQLLIDGMISGCALDGAEGPQWMEAWVREMPNVIILPRSSDYSEEVWMEIREKAVSILQTFFLEGIIPKNAVSDEEEQVETGYDDEQFEKRDTESAFLVRNGEQLTAESPMSSEFHKKHAYQLEDASPHSHDSGISQSSTRSEERHGRSGKKGKKRPSRRKSHLKSDSLTLLEKDSNNSTSQREDDTSINGRDQGMSSSSRFASPEDSSRIRPVCPAESTVCDKPGLVLSKGLNRQSGELLKDGYVIALHARGRAGYHVSRQRVPGGGWFLDTMSNVTKRDPAAQFLVAFRTKINRRMEFVFASHSFDVWESWMLEGSSLDECRLVNCRNPLAVLDVCVEILAAVGEEDGVARWLS